VRSHSVWKEFDNLSKKAEHHERENRLAGEESLLSEERKGMILTVNADCILLDNTMHNPVFFYKGLMFDFSTLNSSGISLYILQCVSFNYQNRSCRIA